MTTGDPQYYFVHLPKCAGTSLLTSLSRIGPRRLLVVSEFPQSKRAAADAMNRMLTERGLSIDDPDLIFGHDVFYGIHEGSSRPIRYATVMRDPVERWISQYRYFVDCSQNENSPIHEFARSAVLENGQVLSMEECALRQSWANMMTHYLAAAVDPNWQSARWAGQADAQLTEMAKDFVTKMDFIAFVDSIAQDEATIAGWFGLSPKLSVVNPSKAEVAQVANASTLEMIQQINALDQDVYDFARRSGLS